MTHFKQAFHLHRYLLLFAAVYSAIVIGGALMMGATAQEFKAIFSYFVPAAFTSLFFPGLILLFYLGRALIRTPKRALTVFEDNMSAYVKSGRLHNALVTMLALFPVVSFFCIGKSMIPHLVPYYLDPLLADLDHMLHLGRYPHELLTPWIGKFELAHVFDDLYLSWFLAVYLVTEFCTWADTDQKRRMRYLWTYVLCWVVIGNIMAILLSSVGPIYFEEYYHVMPAYHELLDHLRSWSTDAEPMKMFAIAAELHNMATDDSVININAISAMPSLHIAIAALLFLYMKQTNRAAWIFLVLYFALILIGSVYLGWHYAIDGYAGALCAWALWRLSGPLVERLHGKDAG